MYVQSSFSLSPPEHFHALQSDNEPFLATYSSYHREETEEYNLWHSGTYSALYANEGGTAG